MNRTGNRAGNDNLLWHPTSPGDDRWYNLSSNGDPSCMTRGPGSVARLDLISLVYVFHHHSRCLLHRMTS
ncbi:hypothetical protein SFOMI_2665 [Sphingobium fuliginis]|uniref:Uncharacterized protein n=1 Tax=Sphingobium fuliginis (strain ATCC 27551) TaxID=336203 RepID=A0A292ZGY6_SPHSA|nr:hypothetical protein SFOMI_2665 [Sphingobium fuliginis]